MASTRQTLQATLTTLGFHIFFSSAGFITLNTIHHFQSCILYDIAWVYISLCFTWCREIALSSHSGSLGGSSRDSRRDLKSTFGHGSRLGRTCRRAGSRPGSSRRLSRGGDDGRGTRRAPWVAIFDDRWFAENELGLGCRSRREDVRLLRSRFLHLELFESFLADVGDGDLQSFYRIHCFATSGECVVFALSDCNMLTISLGDGYQDQRDARFFVKPCNRCLVSLSHNLMVSPITSDLFSHFVPTLL